jgi:hypothetical protein
MSQAHAEIGGVDTAMPMTGIPAPAKHAVYRRICRIHAGYVKTRCTSSRIVAPFISNLQIVVLRPVNQPFLLKTSDHNTGCYSNLSGKALDVLMEFAEHKKIPLQKPRCTAVESLLGRSILDTESVDQRTGLWRRPKIQSVE